MKGIRLMMVTILVEAVEKVERERNARLHMSNFAPIARMVLVRKGAPCGCPPLTPVQVAAKMKELMEEATQRVSNAASDDNKAKGKAQANGEGKPNATSAAPCILICLEWAVPGTANDTNGGDDRNRPIFNPRVAKAEIEMEEGGSLWLVCRRTHNVKVGILSVAQPSHCLCAMPLQGLGRCIMSSREKNKTVLSVGRAHPLWFNCR